MMQRRKTKAIHVGTVTLGSGYPIAIQSMLCARPEDIEGNIRQASDLKAAGCDIIRVAIPSKEDVRLIPAIKNAVDIPVVADIQFDYRLAVEAAYAGVDKVRINPGNIGDEQKIAEVVNACRQNRIPIRVGVNSGSLEKSVKDRFGRPTAEALAASALYNVECLEKLDFYDYLVAIKSSDTRTTIEANRIFAAERDCPLHLGVTEAGTERMGLIKSSAALGALLCDGIGDTVRISLTADPLREVLAAKDLLKALGMRENAVQLVSCPTCGRCKVDLFRIAQEAEAALAECKKPLKVAIMGCAVNGPGEASDADLGLAGGDGEMLLFAKGVPLYKVPQEKAVDALLEEINKL